MRRARREREERAIARVVVTADACSWSRLHIIGVCARASRNHPPDTPNLPRSHHQQSHNNPSPLDRLSDLVHFRRFSESTSTLSGKKQTAIRSLALTSRSVIDTFSRKKRRKHDISGTTIIITGSALKMPLEWKSVNGAWGGMGVRRT